MTLSIRPFPRLARLAAGARFYLALRYAAAALGAAKGLLLAKLLGAESFGVVALAMQLAGLFEMAGLGGAAGYLLRRFGPERGRDAALPLYPAAAALWLAAAGALALLAAPFAPLLFWAALLFLVNIPYLAFEPLLRAQGRFAATVTPQLMLNPAVILFALALYAADPAPAAAAVLAAVAAGHLCGQIAFLALARRAEPTPAAPRSARALLAAYLGFVRAGFPTFLGGMLYMALSFVDRLFLAGFYPPAALGAYALALQVLLVALLGIQAWSTVATTRIGAAIDDPARLAATVRHALRTALLIAAGAGAAAAAIGFLFERTVYAGYPGLFAAVCTGGVGLVAYNAVSAAAALIYLRGRQAALHRALAAALAASLAADAALAALGAGWLMLLASTSAIFCGLSLFTAALIRRCLRPNQGERSDDGPPAPVHCSL